MKLSEYIDTRKLEHHLFTGLVVARRHSTLPLTVYSYGRRAVFDNHWDDVTRKTRGLIVDDDGNIIARPYEKFFSYEFPGVSETYARSVENIDKAYGPPVITEKINGCLGVYWKYGEEWGISTKGSFNSEHAKWATKWMQDHVQKYGTLQFPEGYTPVFEIICQDVQPHVIKYRYDECVLLSLINIETGEELSHTETVIQGLVNELRVPVEFTKTLTEALGDDSDYFEGYVATWHRPGLAPFKLKVKFPTFLENRKVFYEEQKQAKEQVVKDDMTEKAKAIVKEALVTCTTRKEFADYFNLPNHKPYASICFKLLDYDGGKSVNTGREGTEETSTVG